MKSNKDKPQIKPIDKNQMVTQQKNKEGVWKIRKLYNATKYGSYKNINSTLYN